MALINCPECNNQVSDTASCCPHCGFPLSTPKTPQVARKVTSKWIKPLVIILVVFCVVSVFVYFFNIRPNQKYEQAQGLLLSGDYLEAQQILKSLGDYKDCELLLEQAKYESIAYNCIAQWKTYLKNPDSFSLYDIYFYAVKDADDDALPLCLIHYGAQNGFGGMSTGYVVCLRNSEDDPDYTVVGFTDTLDVDDIDPDDDTYIFNVLAIKLIEDCKENRILVGNVDMQRLTTLLKTDTYQYIKILE